MWSARTFLGEIHRCETLTGRSYWAAYLVTGVTYKRKENRCYERDGKGATGPALPRLDKTKEREDQRERKPSDTDASNVPQALAMTVVFVFTIFSFSS